MVAYIIAITIALVALILYVNPITKFFEFETLNLTQLLICIAIGFASVIWYELVKLIKRTKAIKLSQGNP